MKMQANQHFLSESMMALNQTSNSQDMSDSMEQTMLGPPPMGSGLGEPVPPPHPILPPHQGLAPPMGQGPPPQHMQPVGAPPDYHSYGMEHSPPGRKRGGVGGWGTRGRRRKRPRDINAPKQPLNGYVRFLNENREKARLDNPQASFSEITKLLANEWTQLKQTDKQRYFDEAEKDKERYLKELEKYQQTDSYRIFTAKKQQDKKRREMMGDGGVLSHHPLAPNNADVQQQHVAVLQESNRKEDEIPGFDIPIFTEEFLDHNKAREAELRQLRKSNTEYEEQNAILSKHIETMKTAIEKLEVETIQQRNNNMALQQHLSALRATLTTNFAAVPLPGTNEVPTLETIDMYMSRLHTLILDSPQENDALISTVRDIVGRLDYQG